MTGDYQASFKANPPAILKDKNVSYDRKDGGVTKYKHASLGQICVDIAKGLGKMAQLFPAHFADVLKDDIDSTAADAFLQAAVFGEEKYA